MQKTEQPDMDHPGLSSNQLGAAPLKGLQAARGMAPLR
jgi:hypothetical protein